MQPDHRAIFLPDSCDASAERTHWCAVIMAVALAYRLRLPPGARAALACDIRGILSEQACLGVRCCSSLP